jgi:hypothetical protein
MSEAVELILNGYVKLGGRKELEDMRDRRRRVANELKLSDGVIDLSSSIKRLEDEIAVIDAGLAKLSTAAAA